MKKGLLLLSCVLVICSACSQPEKEAPITPGTLLFCDDTDPGSRRKTQQFYFVKGEHVDTLILEVNRMPFHAFSLFTTADRFITARQVLHDALERRRVFEICEVNSEGSIDVLMVWDQGLYAPMQLIPNHTGSQILIRVRDLADRSPEFEHRLMLLDLETSVLDTLVMSNKEISVTEHAWSPNDKRIVYSTGNEVNYFEFETGAIDRIVRDGTAPMYIPGADEVAFLRNNKLFSTTGSYESEQIIYENEEYIELKYVLFSPDGQWLRISGYGQSIQAFGEKPEVMRLYNRSSKILYGIECLGEMGFSWR